MNAFSAAFRGHDIAAPAPEPLAVSPREAAKLLGISERFLAKLIATGELPSARVGARRLLRPADLDAWLAARVHQTQRGPSRDD
jgi:DNA binding domain, excisionase family